MRAGKQLDVEVPVGEAPERPRPVDAKQTSSARATPGLVVTDLTPEFARRLGSGSSPSGAVVTDVVPGGPAAEAGLRPGDVVIELNGRPVRSAQDIERQIRQAAGRDLVALVNRGGTTASVVIDRA